jgi:hypothetical protein
VGSSAGTIAQHGRPGLHIADFDWFECDEERASPDPATPRPAARIIMADERCPAAQKALALNRGTSRSAKGLQ